MSSKSSTAEVKILMSALVFRQVTTVVGRSILGFRLGRARDYRHRSRSPARGRRSRAILSLVHEELLPDGRMVVMSGRRILRREPDGALVVHADLSSLSDLGWNEIVADGRGNAYVNNVGFDMMAGAAFAPGIIALVAPDGSARQVAGDVAFPNGMAVTPDNSTLIVARPTAESSRRSTSPPTAAFQISVCGPALVTACLTVSASMPRMPSGTQMSPTSVACAFARAARCWRRSISIEAASPACWEARIGEPCLWWRPSGEVPRAWPTASVQVRC